MKTQMILLGYFVASIAVVRADEANPTKNLTVKVEMRDALSRTPPRGFSGGKYGMFVVKTTITNRGKESAAIGRAGSTFVLTNPAGEVMPQPPLYINLDAASSDATPLEPGKSRSFEFDFALYNTIPEVGKDYTLSGKGTWGQFKVRFKFQKSNKALPVRDWEDKQTEGKGRKGDVQ